MQDKLDAISLLSLLDAYPEPAFILCLNISPRQVLKLVYGNATLHSLILGPGSSSNLDDSALFGALTRDDDLRWLHNPTYAADDADFKAGYTRIVEVRPPWIPVAHIPSKLQLTATPITLPITVPRVGSSSRSFVFIASPSEIFTQFVRTATSMDVRRQIQTSSGSPPSTFSTSAVPNMNIVGSSSSLPRSPSSSIAASNAEVPSHMINTYAWENTSLGPRGQWPTSLTTMVQYILAKQEPVCIVNIHRT